MKNNKVEYGIDDMYSTLQGALNVAAQKRISEVQRLVEGLADEDIVGLESSREEILEVIGRLRSQADLTNSSLQEIYHVTKIKKTGLDCLGNMVLRFSESQKLDV